MASFPIIKGEIANKIIIILLIIPEIKTDNKSPLKTYKNIIAPIKEIKAAVFSVLFVLQIISLYKVNKEHNNIAQIINNTLKYILSPFLEQEHLYVNLRNQELY